MHTEKIIKKDPILDGPKIRLEKETPILIDLLTVALGTEQTLAVNAETEVTVDGRTLYIHGISYRGGTRYSVSCESINEVIRKADIMKACPIDGKEECEEEKLRAYFKVVGSVRCLEAFGDNMIPLSRFYYYYRRLEDALMSAQAETMG